MELAVGQEKERLEMGRDFVDVQFSSVVLWLYNAISISLTPGFPIVSCVLIGGKWSAN